MLLTTHICKADRSTGKALTDMPEMYSSSCFYIATRDILRVLQRLQIKLILLCVLAEPAGLGSAKTALKFKYEI